MSHCRRRFQTGFTLIEIIVVISIVGLLATAGVASYSEVREQSRDKYRAATLKQLQLALQVYKAEHGRYPEGCKGDGNWSGNVKTGSYKCNAGEEFIQGGVGRPFFPKYMSEAPRDPLYESQPDNYGFIYITNFNGDAYKLMAYRTVENDEVAWEDELALCSTRCKDPAVVPAPALRCAPPPALPSAEFTSTYAVYAGADYICQ